MKSQGLILCCCTLLLLLITLVSTGAGASTGSCSLTTCPTDGSAYQCPTDGSTCQVTIQRNGSSVTLMANGTAYTVFCAKPGTPFEWRVVDATSTSFADIRFDPNTYPFPKSSILADSVNAASASISSTPGATCYQFAVADCPAVSGAGSCGYADPKVVMHPPALRHRRHGEDEDKDDKKPKQ